MKKILFIGMPGSGKGTQAQLLERFGFAHISTGDVIREAFEKKDSLLLPYKKHINSGGLLPDKLIFNLIKKQVDNKKNIKGIILDGAVRTLPQAKFVVENNLADFVFFFSIPQSVAVKRLENRMKTSVVKRADDNPTVFKKRFEEYKNQTAPVIKFLKQKTRFYEVDASGTIEEINYQVLKILKIQK